MKKTIIISLLFLLILNFKISAQVTTTTTTTTTTTSYSNTENFGHTLNLGIGIGGYAGYYAYVGESVPVFHIDYEFNVAKDFTLAPFLNFYSYRRAYYYGRDQYLYYYHETVIPIGVKGTYYFNRLLHLNSNWDLYLAGSLGFAIRSSHWDNGYPGDRNYYESGSPLFLDLHIGAEYHISHKIGIFLDLSTGVSTIGLAIH